MITFGQSLRLLLSLSAFLLYGAASATDDIDYPKIVFGISVASLMAAFAGSLCALAFLPTFNSKLKLFAVVSVGTIGAGYSVVPFVHWFNMSSVHQPSIAFFSGLLFHAAMSALFQRLPAIMERIGRGGAK